MAWCFNDESNVFTDSIQDRLLNSTAFVPGIWPLEVANTLLVAERKKRLNRNDSNRFIALISALPIVIESAPPFQIFHNTLPLARTHQLSSYDASYLELAIHKKLPIATLDKAMIRTAKSIKISIVEFRNSDHI
jgi:predicted nucleic acid-binding protein